MGQERLTMRKIKEILRYYFSGITSTRQIGLSVGCGKSSVGSCIQKSIAAGIKSFEDISGFTDTELEELLYTPASAIKRKSDKEQPDWNNLHEELRKPHVTLALLWTEYKAEHPAGYEYSHFCETYRVWSKKLSLSMRQVHKAGEKSFVDFCDGLNFVDAVTGERIPTELFVGVLGASSYVYARAVLSQDIRSWIDCHCRMYEYFKGVTAITVPDNLKSGVTKPDRYEPEINSSYREMSEYYGTCIIPARVRKPKDKAKAEASVLVVQRWILAALRGRTFYSLFELNAGIEELLEKLNNKIMRHLGKSRKELYETIDRPALKPLPSARYEYAEWKKVRVNIDYHICFDWSYYSAPCNLVQEELWCRATGTVIELYYKNKRITSHMRSVKRGEYVTKEEHRPKSHREYKEWTPTRIISWGSDVGKNTGSFIEALLNERKHPEQAYRSALGVIRLAKQHGNDRVEKACAKALSINSISYKTVDVILKKKMEEVPVAPKQISLFTSTENVRGRDYYNEKGGIENAH